MNIEKNSLFHNFPELDRYKKEVGEAKLGEALTIVSHPFSEEIDNQSLLQICQQYGMSQEDLPLAKKVIDSTGFTHRFMHYLPNQEINLTKEIDRTTDIGAFLLIKALSGKPEWNNEIDLLIVTSVFLPDNVNDEILQKAGLDSSKVFNFSYRTACAGGIQALTDILADNSYHNARVAIASLEPLSLVLNKKHLMCPDGPDRPDGIVIPAIFGDDYAVMLVDPSKFELTGLKTSILPDGGVIRLNTYYDFDSQPNQPEKLPNHYFLEPNAEELFKYSNHGVFMKLFPPDDGQTTTMDGVATGFHFGDNTAKQIGDLLRETNQLNLLRELGNENLIIHPASRPVVNRIAKKLKLAGLLDKRSLPFSMDKYHRSNSSSATTLVRWQHMINQGLINPKKPLLLVAPGIGSVIVTATARVNP